MTNITNDLLFNITHHGTWSGLGGTSEPFYNERIVRATDADALLEWATKVCYAGWNPETQAITISRLTPCVIEANDMKLEGSSKWMVGRSSTEMVLWSSDHNIHEQEMGLQHMRKLIANQRPADPAIHGVR